VGQLLYLQTATTTTTRIAIGAVFAVEVLRIGYGQGQRTSTSLSTKELCMAHTTSIDTLGQVSLQTLVSYNIGKSHSLRFILSPSR
jgi:hypothetical protein